MRPSTLHTRVEGVTYRTS